MKPRIFFLYALMSGLTFGLAVEAGAENQLNLYGYFTTNWEKVFNEPGLENGRIVKESSPDEFSFPFFNLMAQQQLDDHFRIFINLNGANTDQLESAQFLGRIHP